MYFELQLSADSFRRVVRNALSQQNLCGVIGKPEEYSASGNPVETYLIDSVDILKGPDDTVLRLEPLNTSQIVRIYSHNDKSTTVAVQYLQVTQNVNLNLVLPHDLSKNGSKRSPVTVKAVQLVLDIGLSVPVVPVRLPGMNLTLMREQPVLTCSVSPQAAVGQLSHLKVDLPLDFSPLSAALESDIITAFNAAITCDDQGRVVIIRVDFDLSNGPSIDEAFFSGKGQNLLDGNDWVMLLDQRYLCAKADKKLHDGFSKHSDKVSLAGSMDIGWHPVACWVKVVAPCKLHILGDVGLDFTLTASNNFDCTTDASNTLINSLTLDVGPSGNTDLLGIGLVGVGAAVWTFLGAWMWGAFIKGALDLASYVPGTPNAGVCEEIDKRHYVCRKVVDIKFSLIPGNLLQFTLVDTYGIERGLVVGGMIVGLVDTPINEFDIKTPEWFWNIEGDCQNGFATYTEAVIQITGDALLCSAEKLDDGNYKWWFDLGDRRVRIRPGKAPGDMPPVDCHIRVVTNLGIRDIFVTPPKTMTLQEAGYLYRMIHIFENVCRTSAMAVHVPGKTIEPPGPLEDPHWSRLTKENLAAQIANAQQIQETNLER